MDAKQQIGDPLWKIWCETESASAGSVFEDDLRMIHRSMDIPKSSPNSRRRWIFGFAAALALLFITGGEYFILRKGTQTVETVSLITSPDSKGEFSLPDGSHVWLNSSSSLTYNKSNPRLVKLDGEGFFDVAKKDGQEFVVKSGTISVKVLGTRFNVRNSSHFDYEEVSLVSGKVEIESGERTEILSPGERAEITAGAIETKSADVTFDSAWIGRELVFDNVALSDILTSLEHWYNVNIRVAPSVNQESRLSFKVRKESLAETERIITRITGYRFKTLDTHNIIITRP